MGRKKRHGGGRRGSEVRASLRQATMPAEIRIGRSPFDTEMGAWLDRFLADAAERAGAREGEPAAVATAAKRTEHSARPDGAEEFFQSQMELMLRVGTGLWRMRQVSKAPDAVAPSEARRTQRHLESVWQAMADAGFTIVDHTHEHYEPRMALRVVSIEPTEGQVGEVVQETLKPSIYYKDRCIQMGEVIIAVPKEAGSPPEAQQSGSG